ncbi:IclR family transcriptional regulator [Desulfobacula sp.]|uniref:IclR family transcriptional regulator n=1 Tax=Desulfobacula sp. TaxID=2593537 RepID=UPI00262EC799|nr:IclR family transcriptional regulator [Desulfobacula sp.]
MKQITSPRTTAVDRAIDVIELLSENEGTLSLSQIMNKLDIPKQSLIRILNTLCVRGIIDKAEKRGFYRLGMNLLFTGNHLQDKRNLRSIAWPFMQELSQKVRKTIELSILDRDQLVCIERIQGNESVNIYSRIGAVYPYFHAVSVGKVYLAQMDSEKRKENLKKIGLPAVTENTITNARTLEKELQKVKNNGFAFEDQELRKGVRRVAAPIYDNMNKIVGCISIAAPIFSFVLDDVAKLGVIAKETADEISKSLELQ